MGETYEVVIPLCPECGGDMQDTCQMSDEAVAALDSGAAVGTHFCPLCQVFAYEDEQETRTEYRQMIHHTDESSDALIEIRVSDDPNMVSARSDWWRWEDNQPVLDTSYTGVDDAFSEIMTDVDL